MNGEWNRRIDGQPAVEVVGRCGGCYNAAMNLDTLRTNLLDRPAVTEETPFGPDALVFKVFSKMFALIAWMESPMRITLKCDPVRALELRDQYAAVLPGCHMNKRHWNTVILDSTIEDDVLEQMISDSYSLVVRGLPKYRRDELAGLGGN